MSTARSLFRALRPQVKGATKLISAVEFFFFFKQLNFNQYFLAGFLGHPRVIFAFCSGYAEWYENCYFLYMILHTLRCSRMISITQKRTQVNLTSWPVTLPELVAMGLCTCLAPWEVAGVGGSRDIQECHKGTALQGTLLT